MITSENYFELYMLDGQPLLSHSLLKSAMPMNGGDSYRIQMAYENLIEKKDSPAKALGSLMHLFVEDPDQFVWQPEWEMSDNIQIIAEKLYTYAKLQGPVAETPITYIEQFNILCQEQKWGQSWTEETRYKKFREAAMLFWLFMMESEGKIPIHGGKLEQMKGMISSLEDSEMAVPLLRDRPGVETHRELCILWRLGNFKAKSMLDVVEVNRAVNMIDVWDFKTTGSPVTQFLNKYSYVSNNTDVEAVPLIPPYVKYNYFTQEYLYKLAAKQWAEENDMKDAKINFHFAVVESAKPYVNRWVRSAPDWMKIAEKEVGAALTECDHWFQREQFNQF